jgi:FkbM family methyltransferase
VHAKQVGIGVKEETITVNMAATQNDATQLISVQNNGQNAQNAQNAQIELEPLEKIMADWSISKIDLLQINIEGAEYDILENWMESGMIKKIQTIQIQFHNFPQIENYVERRATIRNQLRENGFRETYNFQWVWECWTQNSS